MRVRAFYSIAILFTAGSPLFGVPSVTVSANADDSIIRIGESTTARVYAQILSPSSPSDGIFTYDISTSLSPIGVVTVVPGSVVQPNVDSPFSSGAISASGLVSSYGAYFFVQNRGIAAPQEMLHFSIQGAAIGTTTLAVSGDTTIGDDFLLQQSAPPAVSYAGATASISVRPGDEWKGAGGGAFGTAGNWVGNSVPGGVGSIADFLTSITADSTVTLSSGATVGVLRFSNSHSYTLGGSGTLTLQAATGKAYVIAKAGAHTVSAPVLVNTDTDVEVRAGAVMSLAGTVTTAAGRTVTKVGPGTLSLAGSATIPTLALSAGKVSVAGTAKLGALTGLTSARLGLAPGGRLVLTGTSESALLAALQSGFAAGAWSGNGIVTDASAQSTGVAWGTAAELGLSSWGTATGLAPSDLLLKASYYGDLNHDGTLNADDYALMDRSVAKHLPARWYTGDFNYDGLVNASDYLLMDRAFGLRAGPLSPEFLAVRESQFGTAYVAALTASVPEPAVAAISILPMLARRRRR